MIYDLNENCEQCLDEYIYDVQNNVCDIDTSFGIYCDKFLNETTCDYCYEGYRLENN